MAYRCALAPSRECDGCMECMEYDENEMERKVTKAEYEADMIADERIYARICREEGYDGDI